MIFVFICVKVTYVLYVLNTVMHNVVDVCTCVHNFCSKRISTVWTFCTFPKNSTQMYYWQFYMSRIYQRIHVLFLPPNFQPHIVIHFEIYSKITMSDFDTYYFYYPKIKIFTINSDHPLKLRRWELYLLHNFMINYNTLCQRYMVLSYLFSIGKYWMYICSYQYMSHV